MLGSIPNGQWNINNAVALAIGSHNTLVCNSGYVAIPALPVLTCQSDSQWDVVLPRCAFAGGGSCASLAEIPHGHWNQIMAGDASANRPVSYEAGASNRMTCDQGYVLVGDPVLTCINSNWDYPLPRCDSLSYQTNTNIDITTPPSTPPSTPPTTPPSTPPPIHVTPPPINYYNISFPSNYECSGVIELGFWFRFYGQYFDRLKVSPNGYLTFDTSSSGYILPRNTSIPNSLHEPIIAFWATPLNSMENTASYAYAIDGSDGHHRFILSVRLVSLAGNDDSGHLSVDVILHEGSNDIEFQYSNTPVSQDQNVVLGIQDAQGSVGQSVLYNNQPATASHSNLEVRFNLPEASTSPSTNPPVSSPSPLTSSTSSNSWLDFSNLWVLLGLGLILLIIFIIAVISITYCRNKRKKAQQPLPDRQQRGAQGVHQADPAAVV
jgi:hypothetical protein